MASRLILFLSLILTLHVFGQDTSNVWNLYQTKSGVINYEITIHPLKNGKIKKATEKIDVKMSFSHYGAIMLIEWCVPGQEPQKVLKINGSQYCFYKDSLVNVMQRKYDFDFEKIIMNKNYLCKECIIVTAKPLKEKHLELNCTKNFMFYSKDIPNRGSLTNYQGIPLKMIFGRTKEDVLKVTAVSIDFSINEEIEKLIVISNSVR